VLVPVSAFGFNHREPAEGAPGLTRPPSSAPGYGALMYLSEYTRAVVFSRGRATAVSSGLTLSRQQDVLKTAMGMSASRFSTRRHFSRRPSHFGPTSSRPCAFVRGTEAATASGPPCATPNEDSQAVLAGASRFLARVGAESRTCGGETIVRDRDQPLTAALVDRERRDGGGDVRM